MATVPIDITSGKSMEVMHAIAELPRRPAWAKTRETREQLDDEEAILRDDLVAYNYAYASMNLDAVMAYFADDVVIANPGGTFTGAHLIRRNYEWLFKEWPSARHHWGDVVVRFVAPDEAYRTAIIYEIYASNNWWGVSTDIHHLKKQDGRWKIVRRRIVEDGSFTAAPYHIADTEEGRRALLAEAEKTK